MIKHKLINKRKSLKISQQDMAFRLNLDQAQYSRRENGLIRISNKEWEMISKILDVTLEEIYDPNDDVNVVNNKGSKLIESSNILEIPSFMLDTMKKYIEKLEEEIKKLKINN